MELPFIYKYQPLYLKDFEIDEELLILIKTLITMDTLNVLFVGDSGCGKSSFIQAIIREYYGNFSEKGKCNGGKQPERARYFILQD